MSSSSPKGRAICGSCPTRKNEFTRPMRTRFYETSRPSSWRRECALANCSQPAANSSRSEEHTSELQSPYDLVCRLLLEKKKKKITKHIKNEIVIKRKRTTK